MAVEEFKKRKIGSLTRARPTIVSKDEPMSQALTKIKADTNRILVVADDEQKTVGVVSWSDVLGKPESNKPLEKENVIVTGPVTISPLDTVDNAIQKMLNNNLNKLVVVDEKQRPIGIITKKDLRDQLSKSFRITL